MKLRSVDLVRKALQNLPAELDATYDRMLQSINTDFQQGVISMLKWLCFSSQVLTLRELAEIFVLPLPKEAVYLADLESRRLFDPRDVLAYLGSFVVVSSPRDRSLSDGDDNAEVESDTDNSARDDSSARRDGGSQFDMEYTTVHLAHFSIKEYLISQRIADGPATAFSFSEANARIHIAHSSLRYADEVTSTEEDSEDDLIACPHPLLRTAVVEWMVHFDIISPGVWPAEVPGTIKRVLATRSPILFYTVRELLRSGSDLGSYLGLQGGDYDREWQPLPLSSRLGLRQVTDLLISTTEYLTQEDLDVALQEAAVAGHGDLVKLLLDRAAHVNSETTPLCNALYGAAMGNRLEVVKLLIDRGADINSRHRSASGALHRVLQVAAENDNLDMVKYLVERVP